MQKNEDWGEKHEHVNMFSRKYHKVFACRDDDVNNDVCQSGIGKSV